MFQVSKVEPDFFKRAVSKVNNPKQSSAWSDSNIKGIREDLRNHILNDEQGGLCIYCEVKVDDTHVEHYKTRSHFPQLTLEYDNLIVSCNDNNHCAKYKDNKYKISKDAYVKFINPVLENPQDFLDYTAYGEICAKGNLNEIDIEKAEKTIEILNLNYKSLVEDRKRVADCVLYVKDDIKILDDMYYLKNYKTYKIWIFENLIKGVAI